MKTNFTRFFLLIVSMFIMNTIFAHKGPEQENKKRYTNATKAAGCSPATDEGFLDFNNVRAKIENGGNMFQNRANSVASYEIPKGSRTHSVYAGSLWMGGRAEGSGTLKLAAILFRNGNDFWPGPLTTDGLAFVSPETCNKYDRFFRAFKPDAQEHLAFFSTPEEQREAQFPDGYTIPDYFYEWPAIENPDYAPYADFDANGTYNPEGGDFPGYDILPKSEILRQLDCRSQNRRVPLFGDTTIYWIFNDVGDVHTETGSEPIGMEIRAQAFAFADKSAINNMTFYNYVLINQGTQTLDSCYFAQWMDTDLGNSQDDYVGCDVSRGLGYCYNGDDNDEVDNPLGRGYGLNPPAVGVDFFQGPYQDNDGFDNPGPYDTTFAPFGIRNITYQQARDGKGIPYLGLGIGYGDSIPDNERFGMTKFLYHNGADPNIGDPASGPDFYNYMRGIWRNGSQFYYGGNAHPVTFGLPAPRGADPAIPCNYMFPGDSDPLNWGTNGVDAPDWTEKNSGTATGNPPGDRRFMESSGPFTLRPGAVNNITVGVVWARANEGGALASVQEMFKADDVAQGLFDNCFQIFEGPDAPDVAVSELDREVILFLTNPLSSNNAGEKYAKARAELTGVTADNVYKFEGYQIYQLKDETVSSSNLEDISKARLVSQVDIKNFELTSDGRDDITRPIGNLINWEVDLDTKFLKGVLKVKAANEGIQNSFRVTEDLFATTGDKRLVNNKKYYFMAIAYGYNNYEPFDPDPDQPRGQAEPYVASRKNGRGSSIQVAVAIPHKTENERGGTILNSQYGTGLPVTRLEGAGNGGIFVSIDPESEAQIMSQTAPPFAIREVKFLQDSSPVEIKIVDPLRVRSSNFELRILDSTSSAYTSPSYLSNGYWELKDLDSNVVIRSNRSIRAGGEQLVLDYGISIKVQQITYPGIPDKEISNVIGAQMIPADNWLSGFADNDLQEPLNWIRAGNLCPADGVLFPDNCSGSKPMDALEQYESLLGGTWTSYLLTSDTVGGPRSMVFPLSTSAERRVLAAKATSVDIVFTADKSKWTRVPVLEMHEQDFLTEGSAKKGLLRRALSVDKNGRNAQDPGFNVAEGTLNGDSGMSWFPGYAIQIETGERLNMAFGEDSYFIDDNGKDMIWNPTSTTYRSYDIAPEDSISFGGRHYVYVFKNVQAIEKTYSANDMGGYDEGKFAATQLRLQTQTAYNRVIGAMNWVGLPRLSPGFNLLSMEEGLVPATVRIQLRVEKKYESYAGSGLTYADVAQSKNLFFNPMYRFSTEGYGVERNVNAVATTALDNIRAVPNPYYAYSSYESSRLDNRIKFTNLPDKCTISIYSVDGTLIRTLTKDTENSSKPQTIIEWDLKNFANIPISSGVYLMHINAPGVGEKVIKWFGTMRQVDLQNL